MAVCHTRQLKQFQATRGQIYPGCKKKVLYDKGIEALEQVGQRWWMPCPIPGYTQGQAGLGSEQPDLTLGIPVH